MQYIEAPAEYNGSGPSLFLAGGISGTMDWQADLKDKLRHLDLTIINPRRRNFPMHQPDAAREQISWEFRHLRKADWRLFWFPPETLCPIALYELGTWSVLPGPLFVGTHPGYQRRVDVVIQTELIRPEIEVVDSLTALSMQVEWFYYQQVAK